MSATITALLATAIFEADPAGGELTVDGGVRAVELLTRVSGGASVVLVLDSGRLLVNGAAVPDGAPGVEQVIASLRDHHTAELHLPAGMLSPQWEALVALYASPPGMWSDVNGVDQALALAVPGAAVVARREQTDSGVRRGSSDGGAGSARQRNEAVEAIGVVVRDLSAAAASRDWSGLAHHLDRLNRIDHGGDGHLKSVLADERRRLATATLLTDLVRDLAIGGADSPAGRALDRIGEPGVVTVVERLATGPSRAERRAYLDWLVANEVADRVLLQALTSRSTTLLRDVAEVVGRRRSEDAVDLLAPLLSHSSEDVRTAAWRALEEIGSPAAIAALMPRR